MGIPAPLGVDASGLPVKGDQATAVLTGTLSAIGPGKCFAFRGLVDVSLWASINTALTTTAGSLTATVASAGALAVGNAINGANVPDGTTIGALAGTSITLALPSWTLPGFVSVNASQITGLPVTAGLLGATVTGFGLPVAGATVLSIIKAAIPAANGNPGSLGTVEISALPTLTTPFNTEPQPYVFALGPQAVLGGADAAAVFTGWSVIWNATVQLERTFDGQTWIACNSGNGGQAQWTQGTPVSFTFGEPEKMVGYRLNCTAYTGIGGTTLNYRISQTGGAAESLAIGPLTSG